MMASLKKWTLLAMATGLLATACGCAAVKPYEMEHMADELMTNSHEASAARHEMKWLEAREGSTGGVGGAGGGCACK
ncbi:MAG: DUF4266 domain-containing protein [Candidatus Krumholzibacteria bacterium]|nr:DUF4266 domain-containing protein [Candidatus Krumholzibacteria bacterium]